MSALNAEPDEGSAGVKIAKLYLDKLIPTIEEVIDAGAALPFFTEFDWFNLVAVCDKVQEPIPRLYELARAVALNLLKNCDNEQRMSAYIFLRSQNQYIGPPTFASSIMPLFSSAEKDLATWIIFLSDPYLLEDRLTTTHRASAIELSWEIMISDTFSNIDIISKKRILGRLASTQSAEVIKGLIALGCTNQGNLVDLQEQLAPLADINGDAEFNLFFLKQKLAALEKRYENTSGKLINEILPEQRIEIFTKAFESLDTFRSDDPADDKTSELFNLFIAPALLAYPQYLYYALSYYAVASENFKQLPAVKALMQLQYFFRPESAIDADILTEHDSETFFKLLSSHYMDDLDVMTNKLLEIISPGAGPQTDHTEVQQRAFALNNKITRELSGTQLLDLNSDLRFVTYSFACRILMNNDQQSSLASVMGRKAAATLFNKGKPVGKEVKTPFLIWVLENLNELNEHTEHNKFSDSMIWKAYIAYLAIKHPGISKFDFDELEEKSNGYPEAKQKEKVNTWLESVFESNISSKTVEILAPLPKKILQALFDKTNMKIEIFTINDSEEAPAPDELNQINQSNNTKISVARMSLANPKSQGFFPGVSDKKTNAEPASCKK